MSKCRNRNVILVFQVLDNDIQNKRVFSEDGETWMDLKYILEIKFMRLDDKRARQEVRNEDK